MNEQESIKFWNVIIFKKTPTQHPREAGFIPERVSISSLWHSLSFSLSLFYVFLFHRRRARSSALVAPCIFPLRLLYKKKVSLISCWINQTRKRSNFSSLMPIKRSQKVRWERERRVADDEIDVFKFGMKGASLRWFIKKSTPRAPYYYWQHYTGGRKKGTHRERFLYTLLLPGTSERDDFSPLSLRCWGTQPE